MLTSAQLQRFEDEGYLVVEDLIDAPTLAAVKREYAELMERNYAGWRARGMVTGDGEDLSFWEKFDKAIAAGFDWYQPFDITLPHNDITDETPMHAGPAVFNVMTHPRLLDVVESLIGPEITSNPIQHVRIKPPERALAQSETRAHVRATDWHQDMGVTLPEADNTQLITIWLAITDATIENGCLQVAPGKYGEMLPHCSRNQVGLADPFVPKTNATPAPVKAGGGVIFHPLTPHGSLANKSDGYRWSFDLRYNVTGQPTGRSQFPEFIARSRANPSSELTDWQAWRDLWLDTRHRLSRSAHIPQHRWAADAPYCA